jgi:hypothetical protein
MREAEYGVFTSLLSLQRRPTLWVSGDIFRHSEMLSMLTCILPVYR